MSHSHEPEGLYGVVAEFETVEELLAAAEKARDAGYEHMDAYSPFPIEELPDALGLPPTRMPWIVLLGGVLGGLAGYALQYYAAVIDYPWNVGGRPLHSWPAFIPVTFELTILGASLAAVFGMLFANRLPEPYHPVFNDPGFDRATRDRFFLCIEAEDPKFDRERTREFLQATARLPVREVDW